MQTVKVLFGLVLICVFISNGHAQDIDKDQLTVYGKVRVFAKADRAHVTFQIKGFGKSLEAAFTSAESQIDAIAEKLFTLGLDNKNLSTTFFHSSENFGDKAFLSSKKDYQVIMTANITTDDLELLQPVVITLSKSNVERISNISFELIDYSTLRLEAMEKAISKAREKAELMFRQLGVESGNIIAIEELRSDDSKVQKSYRQQYASTFNMPLLADSYPLAENLGSIIFAQELVFDSEVKLVYEILNDSKSVDDQTGG